MASRNSYGSPLNRRQFLTRSARASLSLPLLTPSIIAKSFAKDSLPGLVEAPEWVIEARKRIPASMVTQYFQTAGIAPASSMVIEEVANRLRDQNRFGPVDPRTGYFAQIEPDLRLHLAATFGSEPEEVALTHSTSEGINIASWSLNWSPGDEVIISNQEHPANIVPWYNLRDRFGIVIREINLDVGSNLLDEVQRTLSENTRMVSISHVSRNNGRMLRQRETMAL